MALGASWERGAASMRLGSLLAVHGDWLPARSLVRFGCLLVCLCPTSGPHVHMEYTRAENGCFDPWPYMPGMHYVFDASKISSTDTSYCYCMI